MPPDSQPSQTTRERTVLVLQGGGALGAYQAGAYEALAAAGQVPDWVAGISIGAINCAIIAGNPPERRRERLRAFWDMVSSRVLIPPPATDDDSRKLFNEWSAAVTASTGVPGFFMPRVPPAVLMPPGSPAAISVYATGALRQTLLDLVDFELLNSGTVRLSVGAVHVRTGNMKYFDTANMEIRPEHIMASGALPPGLPPVDIDGELYWDGGLVSNTPLQYVLDGCGPRRDMCVFQVDLFSAKGPLPETLFDVCQREKEIRYSSRTRLNTDIFRELQTIRRAIRRLEGCLPEDFQKLPEWQQLHEIGCNAAITIVHLIHRRAAYWTQSNDYEFSRYSIDEHWQNGRKDAERTVNHPNFRHRQPPTAGVMVLDLTRDVSPAETEMAVAEKGREVTK